APGDDSRALHERHGKHAGVDRAAAGGRHEAVAVQQDEGTVCAEIAQIEEAAAVAGGARGAPRARRKRENWQLSQSIYRAAWIGIQELVLTEGGDWRGRFEFRTRDARAADSDFFHLLGSRRWRFGVLSVDGWKEEQGTGSDETNN